MITITNKLQRSPLIASKHDITLHITIWLPLGLLWPTPIYFHFAEINKQKLQSYMVKESRKSKGRRVKKKHQKFCSRITSIP